MSPYSHGVTFCIHKNSIRFTQYIVFGRYVRKTAPCYVCSEIDFDKHFYVNTS